MIRRWLRRLSRRRRTAAPTAPVFQAAGVLDEVRSAREHVAGRVAVMAQNGSLDSGNGDALDAWLERLRGTWRARLADERARSVAEAEARLEHLRAEALRTQLKAAAAKAEVDDTASVMGIARADLLGPAEESGQTRERRRRPRPTSDPLEGLAPNKWDRALIFGLVLLATIGDVVAFKLVVSGVLRDSRAIEVGLLTAAFAAASVGLMHGVGHALRNLREAHGGLGRVAIVLMTLGWLGLGGVAVWFRWHANDPVSTEGSIFGDESQAVMAVREAHLSAVLLAGLFIASGLLAFFAGYSQHHPRASAYRSLRKRLAGQQRRQVKAATAEVEAKEALTHALGEPTRAQRREDAGRAEVDAMIDELKELVRVMVAERIGLPEATNGLTTGRSDAPGDQVRLSADSVLVPRNGFPTDVVRVVSPEALWLSANGHAAPNGHGSLNGSSGGGQA